MSDFFKSTVKGLKDEWTHFADDEEGASSEFTNYIDTGSYILNAALSASIFGGMPDNKILGLGGESTTGKTFYALSMVKSFTSDFEESGVFIFDSERAIMKKTLIERGIDPKRVIISEPFTVEEFKTKASKILTSYEDLKLKERPRMMFVLDSLGQLSSMKEMADTESGKDVRDMTRTQQIKSAFRTLTLRLGRLHVPMIVTNHVYKSIGAYITTNEHGGGSGLKYAADAIIDLSKSKNRDAKTKEVLGNYITVRVRKSRLTIENKEVETYLDYRSGLDRYYGLLPLAMKYDVFGKKGSKIVMPDGSEHDGIELERDPTAFYTQEILLQIDEAAKREFSYGVYQG